MTPEQQKRADLVNKIRELGVPDFVKSEHAYDCWLVHDEHYGQRAVSRGIPGKLPYEVGDTPGIGLGLDTKSRRYWDHYGYIAQAPIIWANECI